MARLRLLAAVAIAVLIAGASLAPGPRARAADVAFAIEMRSISFVPDAIRIDPGDVVTLNVYNNDTGVSHTFDLPAFNVHLGTVSAPMQAGENRTATFTADRTGVFYFYCSVPGHATDAGGGRWTGMAGRLEVGAPPPTNTTAIIVVGLIVLAVSVGAIAYVALRKGRKPA